MIVYDSSTLILIAKIELLDLFLDRSGREVSIPRQVENECCGGKRTFDALLIRKKIDESKIKVIAVKNTKLVRTIEADFNLGKGESEALALALQARAELIAIDDKNGINACKLLGVPFTTAVAILLRSCEQQWVNQQNALSKLDALSRYGRYKSSILNDARMRLEARK